MQGSGSLRGVKFNSNMPILKQSSSRKAMRHSTSSKKLNRDQNSLASSSSLNTMNAIATINEIVSPTTISANIEQIKAKLSVKFSFGCNKTSIDPILTYSMAKAVDKDKNNLRESDSVDRLVYKAGNQVVVYDPENQSQSYLSDLLSNIQSISHISISLNHKYLAICQCLRRDKEEDSGRTQISVYSLVNNKLLKTLIHSSADDYEMTSFSGDSRHLFALLDSLPEKEIHVYNWEKEKLVKSLTITSAVTRLRGIPTQSIGISLSGNKYLKNFYFSSNYEVKIVNALPQSRENDFNFFEQIYLPIQNSLIKQVVLAEYAQSLIVSSGQIDVDNAQPGSSNNYLVAKKQFILIFECNDTVHSNHSNASAAQLLISNTPAALTFELRQTITLKASRASNSVTGMNFQIQGITNCSNGFIISGPYGFIALYDRTDEKRDPYVEVKKFTLGELNVIGVAIYPSEEKFVVLSDSGRLMSVTMDSTVQVDNKDQSPSAITTNAIKDLVQGGYSNESVIALDVAFNRPVFVTISSDRCFRLYNYETCKCEIRYPFSSDEQPMALSIHPSGFQVVISFKDRIKLFNILPDKLKPYLETILKASKEIHYSKGGQFIAAASGINIIIYDSRSLVQLTTLQGHMMSVRNLAWADGDQVLFSSGLDGNVYGWLTSRFQVASMQGDAEVNRIEIVTANNRTSTISSIAVDCLPTSFYKPSQANNASTHQSNYLSSNDANSEKINELSERSLIVIASLDGNIKLVPFNINSTKSDLPIIIPGEMIGAISCMCFTSDQSHLIAGTIYGTIRIYVWPQPTDPIVDKHAIYLPALFSEFLAHSSAVTAIRLNHNDSIVLSTGEDGSTYIFQLIKNLISIDSSLNIGTASDSNDAMKSNLTNDQNNYLMTSDVFKYNNDVILVSTEEIDDHLNEILALNKQLSDITLKTNYLIQQKEYDTQLEKKTLMEKNDSIMYELTEKNEQVVKSLEKKIIDLNSQLANNEKSFLLIKNSIENKYEHKLNEQIERYNSLMEKMENLKQNCKNLLDNSLSNYESNLLNLKNQFLNEEKRLKNESKRINDDRLAEETNFREILNQQEAEYEDELKLLIHAADNELSNERSSVIKLRNLIHVKNTKLDQMKKKLIELSSASKARLTLLQAEKAEKDKLQETLEHYKSNLAERDRALTEKEKIISDLRNTTRTLENFRFVLDHRLQQLSLERGPITSHIEKLEKHIVYMYEQIVDEFDLKKGLVDETQTKDQKLSQVNKEITQLRYEVTLKERYIASFKRDLETIVSSLITGKDLEETIQKLYKRYVKNELTRGRDNLIDVEGQESLVKANPKVKDIIDQLINKPDNEQQGQIKSKSSSKGNMSNNINSNSRLIRDIEQGLIDTAKEADRQRIFKEREASDLRHRLETLKQESDRTAFRLINDNSNILNECNQLRKEVKQLELQVQYLKENGLTNSINSRPMTRDKFKTSDKLDIKADSKIDSKIDSKADTKSNSKVDDDNYSVSDSVISQFDRQLDTKIDSILESNTEGKVEGSSKEELAVNLGRKPSIIDVAKAIHEIEKQKSFQNFAQPIDTRDLPPDTAKTMTTSISSVDNNNNTIGRQRLAPINNNSDKDKRQIDKPLPMYKIQSSQPNANSLEPLSAIQGTGLIGTTNQPNNNNINKDVKKSSKHFEYLFAKLTSENNYLSDQLDRYIRENEMQNKEINRLKKQLANYLSKYLANQTNSFTASTALVDAIAQSDRQIDTSRQYIDVLSTDKNDFTLQPVMKNAINKQTNK